MVIVKFKIDKEILQTRKIWWQFTYGRINDEFKNFQLLSKKNSKVWNHSSYVERSFVFLDISQKLFQISKNILHKSFMIKIPLFNKILEK